MEDCLEPPVYEAIELIPHKVILYRSKEDFQTDDTIKVFFIRREESYEIQVNGRVKAKHVNIKKEDFNNALESYNLIICRLYADGFKMIQ